MEILRFFQTDVFIVQKGLFLYKTPKIVFTIYLDDLLHEDTAGYQEFLWFTGGFIGLEGVTRGYKGLQGVTRALVKPYGEKIVHSGVKAPHLAW